jgi:DMSO reductase anchor subunit
MELIRPTKQGVWGWPGAVNFILGGMAAGFYLLSSLMAIFQSGALGVSQPERFKLLAPALISLGFLALMTGTSHIKGMIVDVSHPLRSRHLFRHLHRSWMSRETLASVTFILAAVLDWLFPHLTLWVLAAAAATALMISHGFILYRVRAVTAWNVPLVPLLFLTSSFTTGSGLMLLVTSGKLTLRVGLVVIALVCVVLDLAVWLLYLRWSRDTTFQEATESLRGPNALIFTVGIGHLLPVLLLLLLLVALDVGVGVELWHIVAAPAGLAMIAGGVSQKAGIILKASYLRGIVLGVAGK